MFEEKGYSGLHEWQSLEEAMKEQYMGDERKLKELDILEASETESKEFVIEKTG